MALASALANTLCAVTGITNKSLRALMIGLLSTTGTLTYLADHLLAEAVLAGDGTSGTAIPTLHKLID